MGQESLVTMGASDEHFRRPAWQKQFADGFGNNSISRQVDVGVTREAASDDLRTGLASFLSVAGPHS